MCIFRERPIPFLNRSEFHRFRPTFILMRQYRVIACDYLVISDVYRMNKSVSNGATRGFHWRIEVFDFPDALLRFDNMIIVVDLYIQILESVIKAKLGDHLLIICLLVAHVWVDVSLRLRSMGPFATRLYLGTFFCTFSFIFVIFCFRVSTLNSFMKGFSYGTLLWKLLFLTSFSLILSRSKTRILRRLSPHSLSFVNPNIRRSSPACIHISISHRLIKVTCSSSFSISTNWWG